MFGRRKKQAPPPCERNGRIPVIRSSICTGERVAGFKDPVSGNFQEFLRRYQVEESEIRREW